MIDSDVSKGWQAQLDLEFGLSEKKTILTQRRHKGPLIIQRPFYPEGNVCHIYILHPPGGVVAGDSLTINVQAKANTSALITTPAATKFYRSDGETARQIVNIKVAEGASFEWVPQETIMYEGAQVRSDICLELANKARFMGWEVQDLGRPAANEGFATGEVQLNWLIYRADQIFYQERIKLDARAFMARWGLNNHSALGTLFVYPVLPAQLAAVQYLIEEQPGRGVTLIENLLICRALDERADRLRGFFQQVWALLRPEVLQRSACEPRIWAT